MTRERLKDWAKTALNRSYWKSVLVAFILSFTIGSASSSGGSGGSAADMDFGNMSDEEIAIFLGVLLVVLIVGFVMWLIGALVKAFLLNPLHVGCQAYFCEGLENSEPNLALMGRGFKSNYKNVTKTMFLRDFYLAMWSLFMWIPFAVLIGGAVALVMFEDSMGVYGTSAFTSVMMVVLIIVFFVGLFVSMIPYLMKVYEYWLIPYILVENPDMESKEVFALTKKMMTGHKWEAFVLNFSFIGWHLLSVCTCGILSIFYIEPYRAYTLAAYYKVRWQQEQRFNMPDYSFGEVWNG